MFDIAFQFARARQSLANLGRTHFYRNARGATSVEFALLAIPFFGVLGASFEAGMVYFKTAELQVVTEQAARQLMVSAVATGMNYGDFVKNYICTHKSGDGSVKKATLSKSWDCDQIMVDVQTSASADWSSVNMNNDFYSSPPAKTAVFTTPQPDQVAVLRIAYPLPVTMPILSPAGKAQYGQVNYGGKQTYMLMGIYAFRVE